MNDDAPDERSERAEHPAIDFRSPGRFVVHNPQSDLPQPLPWEPAPLRLGEATELQRFSEPSAIRQHALAMLQQAKRSLCIYTPDLEPWLYHHSSIQQACTRLLLAHPRNQLRILVGDPARATKEGHRLLQLARRLTSNLHVRRLNPAYPEEGGAYIIVDDCGLLSRPQADQYIGYALYRDFAGVRLHQARFDKAWDHGLSDANLRSFLL
ncbi:DUF7931 domain-containing protein [Pseudomonas lopnurensis]|uniref:DUF7931 domain-containing protein n=1 Tax=Pseudomonas lopnurensis TaxID=1477517 RepID=UPI001879D32C|nr:histone acetyltransferase HPA2 [Pseudomonas lopnurensis]MBE7377040.1 histone acetyltransferase HPA2 [Pseudomonas lopnurensis]